MRMANHQVTPSGGSDINIAATDSESEPLLAPQQTNTPAAQAPGRTLCNLSALLIVCVLERCTYYQHMAEAVDTRPQGDTGQAAAHCGVFGDNSSMLRLHESWNEQLLRSAAYLLPVVGGTLADCWFGCVPVLRFAAVLYVLGTGMLTLAVYLPGPQMLCSLGIKYVTEVTLAVAAGFARPSLLTLAYEASRSHLGPIALNQMYYLGEAVGQVLGSGLAYGTVRVLSPVPLTGASLATAVLMLTLTATACGPERRSWKPDQFHLLGRHRLKRLALVFLPVIVMTTGNVFICFTLNGRAAAYFRGGPDRPELTQQEFLQESNFMLWIYSVGLAVSMLALGLLTLAVPAVRIREVRIGTGLVLATVSQICASFVYSWGPPVQDRLQFYAVFGSVNCLVAASEALTFSTMNEFALLIAPSEIRAYTVGLVYSLWGTGFLFSWLVQLVSYEAVAKNDADQYFQGVARWVCLSLGGAMAAAIVYYVMLAPKAMQFLVDINARMRHEEEMGLAGEPSSLGGAAQGPRRRSAATV